MRPCTGKCCRIQVSSRRQADGAFDSKQNSYAVCEWDNWLSPWSGGGDGGSGNIHSNVQGTSIFAYEAPSNVYTFTHKHTILHTKQTIHTQNGMCDAMWCGEFSACLAIVTSGSIRLWVCVIFFCLRSLHTSSNQKENETKSFYWMRATYFQCQRLHACVFFSGIPRKPQTFSNDT